MSTAPFAKRPACSTSRTWVSCACAAPVPRSAWLAPSSRTLAAWPSGRAQYSFLCAPDGGVIDDLIVYRTAETEFLVVPNASNREVVLRELTDRLAGSDAELHDETMTTSLLAIQGPAAQASSSRSPRWTWAPCAPMPAPRRTCAGRPRDGGPHRLHR